MKYANISNPKPNNQLRTINQFVAKFQHKKLRKPASTVVLRKASKWKKILLALLLFLSISGATLYLLLISPYFLMTEVVVSGAHLFVNEKDLKNLVSQGLVNQRYFFMDLKKLNEDLNKNFLGAEFITLTKIYPNKVQIQVVERIPLAIVHNLNNSNYYLIDGSGYVLGEVTEEFSSLPIVLYEKEISIGTFVNKEIVPISIEIINSAAEADLSISSVSFTPKYTRVYVSGKTEVLIGNKKNIPNSFNIIAKIIKNFSLEGKSLNKIDLRYDKVIVSYD